MSDASGFKVSVLALGSVLAGRLGLPTIAAAFNGALHHACYERAQVGDGPKIDAFEEPDPPQTVRQARLRAACGADRCGSFDPAAPEVRCEMRETHSGFHLANIDLDTERGWA